MRILKLFVIATMPLLFFSPVSSADMTVMSLQERRSQSDAVVVGTIEEVRQTDAGVGGQFPPPVEHWLATCRVERYIIGPKIHNPNMEEAMAVSLIRIAFEQRLQKPMLVKLVAGKKYLLFLKETGPNEYGMITPYHGALEAGEDYFVHDEQSPEYPQALKLSFEEIVQRLTPQNPASSQPAEQVNRASQPLTLTIQTDKQVYEVGEEINIEVSFKNICDETKRVLLYDKPEPSWTVFSYTTLIIVPKERMDAMFTFHLGETYSSNELPIVGEYIKPNESLSYFIPVTQKIKKLYPDFDFSPNIYSITLRYQSPWTASHVGYWTGTLTSNTITIEVVEKKRADVLLEGGKVNIREQLNAAAGYWYAYFRERMLGEGRALRNVHTEGEWTVFESFGKHGFTPLRVLTRFLDAEETKIQGLVMVLDNIKSLLRSSIEQEVEEGVRETHVVMGEACQCQFKCLSVDCIRGIESDEDFLIWDVKEGRFKIDKERKAENLPQNIRGLRFSLAADKSAYAQNEPIVLTTKLKNNLPVGGYAGSVFLVNVRMLIHSEIVFDVRNEKGEYVHFLPPEPPPALTAEDFKQLDGGQSVESQEEIASRLHEKPLRPGRYRIQATYQNYELGKTLGLAPFCPSCAGSSVLPEGGPAWTGKVFSNTITIEVTASTEPATSAMPQPLVIVALNNDGGGIFNFLPIAQFKHGFEKFFGTPHGLNFEAAAQMFDLNYCPSATKDEFVRTYKIALESKTSTLIEVTSDRKQNAAVIQGLQERIRKALGDRL